MGVKLAFLIIVLSIIELSVSTSFAEYRVYKLGIKYDENAKEREVLTTLDNLQYPDYYKVRTTEQVRLINHWMCRGRTDELKKYCKGPNREDASVPQTQVVTPEASQSTPPTPFAPPPGPAQGPSVQARP